MTRPWLPLLVLLCACGGGEHRPARNPADPLMQVDPEVLFQTGLALGRGGDAARAQQYLSAALARGYPEDETVPALVRVCVAANQYRTALHYAEPYLTRNPGVWPVRYLAAAIYVELGEFERARRYLEQVTTEAPKEPDPEYLLAVTLRDGFADEAGAETHLKRYLELAPDGGHAAEAREALRPRPTEVPVEVKP